jgi:hypothetical protein
MGQMHVPFWGILVSKINDLPFSGGAIGANGGRGMSQNEQTIFLENKNVHFRDIKRSKTAQNGPKRPKMAQICIIIYVHVPFWGIVILEINILPKSGHATLCAFS